LKAQADNIAKMIKQAERGELADPTGKIADSLMRGTLKTAVVQDDKVVSIEMAWSQIRETSEVALAVMILKLMRGEREN
jgi:hypothetical protein